MTDARDGRIDGQIIPEPRNLSACFDQNTAPRKFRQQPTALSGGRAEEHAFGPKM